MFVCVGGRGWRLRDTKGEGERETEGKEIVDAAHTRKKKKTDALLMRSHEGQACVMHDDVRNESRPPLQVSVVDIL